INIKQEKLNEFIDAEISEWLDLEAEPVSISKNENDEIIIEGKGNDGKKIQREMLKQAIEIAVINQTEEVIIPVKKISPEINVSEDLQKLGRKDRIAVGHTSYYGSTGNRVHNIKVGADRFNGLLVAPGEELSFNTRLGAVDASTGYRQELVIKGDGTVP